MPDRSSSDEQEPVKAPRAERRRHDHKCPLCGVSIDCDYICCANCNVWEAMIVLRERQTEAMIRELSRAGLINGRFANGATPLQGANGTRTNPQSNELPAESTEGPKTALVQEKFWRRIWRRIF